LQISWEKPNIALVNRKIPDMLWLSQVLESLKIVDLLSNL
jgi:hypothetical protein